MRSAITPEILDRLCYYASLAPSPHNSQAWVFRRLDRAIEIHLDRGRTVLAELDPGSLESKLACGAAAANLRVGAEFEGLAARIEWLPDPRRPDLMARVTLEARGRNRRPADPALFRAMLRRESNRSPYLKERRIPARVLADLKEAVAECGLRLHVITRPVDIGCAARVAEAAGTLKLTHEASQRELHRLMRFDARHASESRDGLDMRLFFLDERVLPVARQALKWPVLKTLEHVGMARRLARENEAALIESAPALALISAPRGGSLEFLRGGEAYEKAAILAAAAGISFHPHSAPIEVALRGGQETDAIKSELRQLFGLGAGSAPVILFRLGYATRKTPFPSLRRPVVGPVSSPDGFYETLTARNAPVIAAGDQERLRDSRVLIAGCGSIGGAAVECLARMGVRRFVLAEPGAYELNNLNRQSARLADVGRNKAEVLRERVRAINPHAEVLVDTRGVAEENAQYLAGSCDVIIDGVDVTEASGVRFKRLLHAEACRQRRPVILGLDLGGAQVVHVCDYRSGRLEPFGGRIDADASAHLNVETFLAGMISPLDLPLDFLEYAELHLRGKAGAAPQLGPTALQFGVLASWAAYDLLCGRPVRAKTRVDIPGSLRPTRARLALELRRLALLPKIRLLTLLPPALRRSVP